MRLSASIASESRIANSWDLWVFPDLGAPPEHVWRFAGRPFTEHECTPDDVEKGYSRGFGLPVRDWQKQHLMPDPARLVAALPAWSGSGDPPPDCRVLVTHRLTPSIVDWLASGGRVILLASKASGGIGTRYLWLFGQVPLVIERGPLRSGDSEWTVDLLGYDLARRYARVIPVEDLDIVEQVQPLVRLLHTHDQRRVRIFDQLFAARVDAGLLLCSSLDHSEAAGQWLLRQMMTFAPHADDFRESVLDPEIVRSWTTSATIQ